MWDIFAPLYPPEASKFKVIDSIPIPGFPPRLVPDFEGVIDLRQFYGDRLIDEYVVSDGEIAEQIAIVDKLIPHSMYDMMILSSDDECKSSISDLSEKTAEIIFKISHGFLEFISSEDNINNYGLNDGYTHICFNYHVGPVDRESGMAEKRFHLHLNYWTKEEFRRGNPRAFESIENVSWKRRLLDPAIFLGAQIAYDCLHESLVGYKVLPPDFGRDLRLGLPAGFKIEFDDWTMLADRSFIKLLRLLHDRILEVYKTISRFFTGTDKIPSAWYRHSLRSSSSIIQSINSMEDLSTASKEGLTYLAKTLRDIPSRTMDFFRIHKWMRIRHLTIAGLCYSIGLYTPMANRFDHPILNCHPIYLVLQPKLFADMGSAGVTYVGNIPVVRIQRGEGLFRNEELLLRHEFQDSFISYIRQLVKDRPSVYKFEIRSP